MGPEIALAVRICSLTLPVGIDEVMLMLILMFI